MKLSKGRLRKILGAPEPTGPADPKVLARRKYQVSGAQLCAKVDVPLQIFFASTGFIVVLLPVLWKGWRHIIEAIPIVATISHDYSTFSGLALINLAAAAAITLAKIFWTVPEAGTAKPSYRDLLYLEDYPRSRRQEIGYWIDIATFLIASTMWLFLPFSVIAYFIRLGN